MTDKPWTRLFVVRHGETKWNFEGRWQGWLDSPLTEKGREQAARAGETLKDCGATAIWTSDAGRARETAEIIGRALNLRPEADAGPRERFYGKYEGMTSSEIDEKFPDTRYEAGRDLRDTWRPVGGETLVEVSARVLTFIRQMTEKYPGETIVLVTHSGVLRVLDALSSRQSLEQIWEQAPANCAIFELDANADGDLKVVRHFST